MGNFQLSLLLVLIIGPKNTDGLTKDVNTQTSCEDFSSHLILGSGAGGVLADGTLDPAKTATYTYVRVADADNPQQTGFRSAVMSSDPADPWGNKYLCNIGAAGVSGEAVWVISAGPNGILETVKIVTTSTSGSLGLNPILQSDDIGYRLQ